MLDKNLEDLSLKQLELAMLVLEFPQASLPREVASLSETQWWAVQLLLEQLKAEQAESRLH